MSDFIVLALGWVLVLVIFLGFLSLRRYLEHRERMAMILRGITPPDKQRNALPRPRLAKRAGVLQGGLITAMIGLALTLGLYPIGFLVPPALATPNHLGPWLLAGLIPLAVGIALILGHYLTPGRPLELPTGGQVDQAETYPGAIDHQAVPPSASSVGEPITLPESRRWMRYHYQSARSTEPPASDEDQDKKAQ